MNFKEYWRINSRKVLIVLILFTVIGFASPYFFGGSYSDSFIWLGILAFVGLVLLVASVIDYNKNHRSR